MEVILLQLPKHLKEQAVTGSTEKKQVLVQENVRMIIQRRDHV